MLKYDIINGVCNTTIKATTKGVGGYMLYHIGFNIAGIVILVLILFMYCTTKHLPIYKNRLFLTLVVLEMILGIMESILIYNTHLEGDIAINAYLCFFMDIFYCMIDLVLGILYAYYCIVYIKDGEKICPALKAILYIPFVCGLFAVLSIVVNVLVFDNKLQLGYFGKNTVVLWCLIEIYYLLLGGAYIYKHRRLLTVQTNISINLFLICAFIPMIIELYCGKYYIGIFGASIGLLVVLFIIQNPQALFDGRTGLFNRDTLITMLNNRIKKEKPFTVISIGIEDIKFLNNTFGISFVDSMLKKVAKFLYDNFSKKIEIYQIAVGHFCLISTKKNTSSIKKIIDIIVDRFSHPWSNDKIEVRFSINICIIECPEDADTVEDIIEYIDETLNIERTKDDVHIVYAKDLDINSSKRVKEVELAIKNALKNNSFQVYYQPIYSTKENRIVSAEALIRLFDEDLGFISPEEFIPISEKDGLILKIGMFVFETVCQFISNNNLLERGIQYIEINLSVVQCMQKQLTEELLYVMSRYNIKGSQINLEITETAAAYSPEMLRINMRQLSDNGISFSLDDYGTGYSNMSYMVDLPFDLVKLDKSIVWASFEKEKALIAMVSTIAMIKKLEMHIVAEGVETEEQMKLLSELGCDYLQGYYFSKPVPENEFLKLLS